MPDSCWHVWRMFIDLNSSRTNSGFGINPISYQEILAYCQLVDLDIDKWELELLKQFDSCFLEYQAKQAEKQSKSKKK